MYLEIGRFSHMILSVFPSAGFRYAVCVSPSFPSDDESKNSPKGSAPNAEASHGDVRLHKIDKKGLCPKS
jgi:hypothetical protein